MSIHADTWDEKLPATQISNSEAAAWLACQRKWYYAHSLKIKPKQYSEALNRGIIGHEALAMYYLALQQGKPFEEACELGRMALMDYYTKSDGDEKQMLYKLLNLLDRYYEIDPFRYWKIIAVEQQYDLPLTGKFGYSMRLDMLAVNPEDHKHYLIDHKFVYDFWNSLGFDLNAQFPKYIVALKTNNIRVDGVIVNQLRHRVDPVKSDHDALFRVVKANYTGIENKRVFREHLQVSEVIAEMKERPLDEQSDLVLRNMSMVTCRNCSYPELCKTELSGQDPTLMIETFYEPNDYGYTTGVVDE